MLCYLPAPISQPVTSHYTHKRDTTKSVTRINETNPTHKPPQPPQQRTIYETKQDNKPINRHNKPQPTDQSIRRTNETQPTPPTDQSTKQTTTNQRHAPLTKRNKTTNQLISQSVNQTHMTRHNRRTPRTIDDVVARTALPEAVELLRVLQEPLGVWGVGVAEDDGARGERGGGVHDCV